MKLRLIYIAHVFAFLSITRTGVGLIYLHNNHDAGLIDTINTPAFWMQLAVSCVLIVGFYIFLNHLEKKEKVSRRSSKEQQAEHDLIFTQSAVGLIKANFQGVMGEVNSYFSSMLGYEPSELTGRAFIEITHPEDIQLDLNMRKQLNSVSGTEFNYNKRWIHKNGSVVWSNVNGTIQRFDNGKIDFFIAAVTNIQPLVAANEALQLEKNKTEAMINNSDDIMWSLSTDLKFEGFNSAFENVLFAITNKYPVVGEPSNFLSDTSDLKPESQNIVSNWGKHYIRALSGDRFNVIDTVLVDRKHAYFDVSVSPMLDEENKIFGVSCVGKNITERMELYKELELSQIKYKDLFESSPIPLMLCELHTGYFIQANQATLSRYQLDGDEIFGTRIHDLIIKDDLSTFKNVFDKISNSKENVTNQELVVRQLGANLEITHMQLVLNKTQRANKDAVLVYCLDISTRKKNEEEILQAVLETEDKERSRISRDLHDGLTQNLTVSSLHLKAIEEQIEELLPEKAQEKYFTALRYLNDSIKESRNLSHHIMPKAILDYGLVLSLEQLIGDLESATEMHFELIENLDGERIDSKAEVHLYRVCQEAIQNILKYSEAKEIVIQVLKYPSHLFLSIEDDGVGMDLISDNHSKGIGLKTMESRALSLAGRFSIESSPKKGTIITIQIPINQPHEVQHNTH